MQKIIVLNLLLILSSGWVACSDTNGQTVINGKLKNAPDSIWYTHSIEGITVDLFERNPLILNEDSSFQIEITSDTPETFTLYQSNKGELGYLYITPGSNNSVIIDIAQKEKPFSFSGTDKEENEVINQLDMNSYFNQYYYRSNPNHELRNDISPKSIYQKISNRIQADKNKLNSPSLSPDFQKKMEQEILVTYYRTFQYVYAGCDDTVSGDLEKEWLHYFKKSTEQINLENPEIASSPRFLDFIENYLYIQDFITQKEKHKFVSRDESVLFFLKQFNTYLTGKTLEASLAMCIADNYTQGKFSAPILDACKNFYSRFPHSKHTESIQKIERVYNSFFNKETNNNIHFINNENISTFQQAISPFAGKVIYIDLWATWCGPCRTSFAYINEVHQYAKENDIVLLYISIDRKQDETKWMQMAQYYNLEGQHIRANDELNDELHTLFGNNHVLAIPHCILVDKSGKVSIQNAAKPDNMETLKKQLKTIL